MPDLTPSTVDVTLADTARSFVLAFSDPCLIGTIAPLLTHAQAAALTDLLATAGGPVTAAQWAQEHQLTHPTRRAP